MKKLLLSFAAIFAATSLMAQYDLEAILENPTEGSTVGGDNTTTFSYSVRNNGPNAVAQGDTIWLSYTVGTNLYDLDGQLNAASGIILPAPFPVGFTLTAAMLQTSVTINTSAITATTEVCGFVIGTNGAIDTPTDPNDTDNANNFSCFEVTPPALSTNELTELSISVFPNPAKDVLNIVANDEIASVVITTMDGKTVVTADSKTIDVASLNVGMYIYKVTTLSGKVSQGNFAKN